jgi:oleate hydratase
MPTSSKSRLSLHGQRQTAPAFNLPEHDILTIERLVFESEAVLGRSTIADQFSPTFFTTTFWLMWCTTFAFQPWHSAAEFRRYLLRFTHMVSGFNRLKDIMRTVYNQYDSLVRPLQKWLEERGVVFQFDTQITDLGIRDVSGKKLVESLTYERMGKMGEPILGEVIVRKHDYVLVTLGSMTEGSSLGGMQRAPELKGRDTNGAWALWEKLAHGRPEFGNPHAFDGNVDASKWISFTTTLSDPTFLRLLRDNTGNVPGEGGLITFSESNWLLSIVVPFQPHFIGQPDNINVFWGYGLYVDKPGNFVDKPMTACTGQELMTELLGHLRFNVEADAIMQKAICIPCMMPFITSQFMPRGEGDRPAVVPERYSNLALIGQFCEVPDDVVFTVEYSIRSAQMAASANRRLSTKARSTPTFCSRRCVPCMTWRPDRSPRGIPLCSDFQAFCVLHLRRACLLKLSRAARPFRVPTRVRAFASSKQEHPHEERYTAEDRRRDRTAMGAIRQRQRNRRRGQERHRDVGWPRG